MCPITPPWKQFTNTFLLYIGRLSKPILHFHPLKFVLPALINSCSAPFGFIISPSSKVTFDLLSIVCLNGHPFCVLCEAFYQTILIVLLYNRNQYCLLLSNHKLLLLLLLCVCKLQLSKNFMPTSQYLLSIITRILTVSRSKCFF